MKNIARSFVRYVRNDDSIQTLLMTHIVIILIFACIYKTISIQNIEAFNTEEEMTFFDCVYFSVVTHTTVGYGDIYPVSKVARTFMMAQVMTVFYFAFMEINDFI